MRRSEMAEVVVGSVIFLVCFAVGMALSLTGTSRETPGTE